MKHEFAVGEAAQNKLLEALGAISQAVGSTMGPGGRPWGFDKLNAVMKLTSTFSKDGLTVLKSLRFGEPSWQAVLAYCKQAASHSVAASGDGTSSTVILANAVAKAVKSSGVKYPQAFARQLEQEAIDAIDAIRMEVQTGDDVVRKVALTSTNGDEELTDVIIEAIKSSSAFGTILLEKNPTSSKRYQIKTQDGYSNCHGYNYNNTFAVSASPEAAASRPIDWNNPYVATFNGGLFLEEQIDPILKSWNEALKTNPKNLVVVCYEVGDQVTNKLLVMNRKLSANNVAAFVVQVRLTAEINSGLQILRDIAAFCGIDEKSILDGGNYKNVTPEFFGTCEKVKISNNNTAFLGRAEKHWVNHRIAQNQSIIDEARSDLDREITKLRNSELAEGLVKVEVGGGHMSELQERGDRFDDGSRAAQATMRSGALPGCGCSYIRAGLLAGVSPELESAFRSIHNTVFNNYGLDANPLFIPPPGKTIDLEDEGLADAREIGVMDSYETVAAVIKNGVSLGVSLATLGGYSFRDTDTDLSKIDYE